MEYTIKNGKTLVTARAQRTDAAELVSYMNAVGGESDNLTFGANECPHTVESERLFLENLEKQDASCMLLGRVEGELVACLSLIAPTRARMAHNAGMGISVRKAYWRQGIAGILLAEGIAFAKRTGVLRAIQLSVREDNPGAIALYEKLGFERVGMHRGEICVEGKYYDTVLMDLYLD